MVFLGLSTQLGVYLVLVVTVFFGAHGHGVYLVPALGCLFGPALYVLYAMFVIYAIHARLPYSTHLPYMPYMPCML